MNYCLQDTNRQQALVIISIGLKRKMMINRMIRSLLTTKRLVSHFSTFSTNSSPSSQTLTSLQHVQSNLSRTLSHIQHQLEKLPVEIQDGTTFTHLYDGILLSIQQLIKKTNQIVHHTNNPDSAPNINLTSIQSTYQYINTLLKQELDIAVNAKNNHFKDKMLNFDMKLGVVLTMIDKIINETSPHSLSLQRTRELLQKHSETLHTNCKSQDHMRRIRIIQKAITAMNATVIYGETKYKYPLQRNLMFMVNFPRAYYFFNRASSISIQHYKKPTIQNIVKIWSTGSAGWNSYLISIAMRVLYPVKTSKMIYVPRKEMEDNEVAYNLFKKDSSRIPIQILIDKNESIHDFEGIDDYNSPEPYDSIVIHVHGGGFVALSSLMSEPYTRRWARETKLPIFSINYRLAPDYPFPSALEDVYHSYLFIINQIHKHSNIRFKKVILTGDSAGGNLVAALTGLLMKNNKPVPDALLLAYPALDLRFIFSQSRIHSFNDPLLFSTLLMSVRQAYLKEESDQNPLVSPIFINQKFLQRSESEQWPNDWPKTRIMIGDCDPLYDDSLRLVDKLDQSNVDVKLYVLQDLGHAFLNMDMVLPECKVGVQKSIEVLKELSKE